MMKQERLSLIMNEWRLITSWLAVLTGRARADGIVVLFSAFNPNDEFKDSSEIALPDLSFTSIKSNAKTQLYCCDDNYVQKSPSASQFAACHKCGSGYYYGR